MHLVLHLPTTNRKLVITSELAILFILLFALPRVNHFSVKSQSTYVPVPISTVAIQPSDDQIPKIPMSENLWAYLRKGLHFLETSGKELSPSFIHPGGVAFGELGLSKIAVQDVRSKYPELGNITSEEIFNNPRAYERFARYYADILLRHYLGLAYWEMPRSDVFEALQKAWFLGPTLYKKSNTTLASREIRAKEFMLSYSSK